MPALSIYSLSHFGGSVHHNVNTRLQRIRAICLILCSNNSPESADCFSELPTLVPVAKKRSGQLLVALTSKIASGRPLVFEQHRTIWDTVPQKRCKGPEIGL